MRFLIILSVLALLVAGGFASYYIWFAPQSAKVDIQFDLPSEVSVGQPFEVAVHFPNPTDQVIQNAKLTLTLPEGISFVGKDQESRTSENLIGDIGPGSLNRQSFNLIVINGVQSVKKISARLTYNLSNNPSAEFESRKEANVTIGQSSISVSFSAPQSIFAGQNFDIGVNYVNNTSQDLDNVELNLEYPKSFQYKQSSIDPSRGNNYWDLGSLAAGKGGEISITGNLVGQEGLENVLNGTIVATYQGKKYVISAQSVKINIASSPLVVNILTNGKADEILEFSNNVDYTINFRNRSNTALANLSVTAYLTSQALDYASLRTEGSLDSQRNTITWTTATTPSLGLLAAGGSGSVSFNLRLKPQATPSRLTDKNYTVRVEVAVESPTVPVGASGDKTESMASLESKIASRLDFTGKALYRDASSGIANSGPYPPRVDAPTKYTIHWILRNYNDDMSNVRVSAFLRPNTKFTGVVKSTIDSKPKYNSQTGEVSWDAGSLAAAQGIIGGALEAIFQVENTPAANELGQESILLSESKLSGKNTFTNQEISSTFRSMTTSLPDDTNLGNDRRVMQ